MLHCNPSNLLKQCEGAVIARNAVCKTCDKREIEQDLVNQPLCNDNTVLAQRLRPRRRFCVSWGGTGLQHGEWDRFEAHPEDDGSQTRTSRFNSSGSKEIMRNVDDCHQPLAASSPSVHRGRSGVCQLLLSGWYIRLMKRGCRSQKRLTDTFSPSLSFPTVSMETQATSVQRNRTKLLTLDTLGATREYDKHGTAGSRRNNSGAPPALLSHRPPPGPPNGRQERRRYRRRQRRRSTGPQHQRARVGETSNTT